MGQVTGQIKQDLNVVIVGGGLAGATLAVDVSKWCSVTIIDQSPLFVQSMASLRACVVPGWMDTVLFDRQKNWPRVTQITGKVIGFDTEKKKIRIEGRESTVSYDYLVLATGSQVAFPGKVPLALQEKGREAIVQAYETCREQVIDASTIVIVGGGPMGVELAGEIIVEHPEKKVVLIQSATKLLSDRVPSQIRVQLQERLSAKGVEILLGQRADISNLYPDGAESATVAGPACLLLDSGREISADLVFNCTGVTPNTTAFEGSLEASQVRNGQIRVNKYLQVVGQCWVFAIGDCNVVRTKKTWVEAQRQAEYLAHLLKSLVKGKSLTRYTVDHKLTLMLSIGRFDGIGIRAGSMMSTDQVRRSKSHDLMSGQVCSRLRIRSPTSSLLATLPPIFRHEKRVLPMRGRTQRSSSMLIHEELESSANGAHRQRASVISGAGSRNHRLRLHRSSTMAGCASERGLATPIAADRVTSLPILANPPLLSSTPVEKTTGTMAGRRQRAQRPPVELKVSRSPPLLSPTALELSPVSLGTTKRAMLKFDSVSP